MKVCIFTATIDKKDGGPSRSVPILAKGLASIGCEVTLMTLKTDDMNTHMLDGSNVKIEILPAGASTSELDKAILAGQYDIIHAQNLWLPSYHQVAVIARKHGIKYVMTPRGTLEPWSLQQKALKKKIAMWLYQRKDLQKAAGILTTADMEAEHCRDLGLTAPMAIIPNGIDVSEYQCRTAEDAAYVRKQIVFLSRIHQKKGVEILVNVWGKLAEEYNDWNVVIAGNGETAYIESLQKMIDSKGLHNCIKIIPPIFGEAKHKLYTESSLFILPSYSENFGMVIAEAMSCGVPAITTTNTPWEQLNAEQLGWCVDLSEENIEKALRAAIKTPANVLFEMGQRSSKYIHDNFLYTSVAKKNLDFYKWILRGNEKPDFVLL